MTFVILVLAVASTTMTLARANVFRAWREWVSNRSDFFGDLVNCTYCTSHWVSFFYASFGVGSVRREFGITLWYPMSWFVLAMSLVAVSSVVQTAIYKSHAAMKMEDYE